MLAFPVGAVNGTIYNAPNGVHYFFDGVRWRVAPANVPIINPVDTPKDGDILVVHSPLNVSLRDNGTWRQVFPALYS